MAIPESLRKHFLVWLIHTFAFSTARLMNLQSLVWRYDPIRILDSDAGQQTQSMERVVSHKLKCLYTQLYSLVKLTPG